MATFNALTFAVVLACGFIRTSVSYPTGAPADTETCDTMLPNHFADAQTGPCPYTITVNKISGTEYEVIIGKESEDTLPFLGFLIQARDQATNAKLGQFTSAPTGTKTTTCSTTSDSVTHSSKASKDSVTLTWIPPPSDLTGVQFVLTIVQSFSVFWTQQKSLDLGEFSNA